MTGSLDDFSLIDKVLAGNTHAYGLLVQRYQSYVYTLIIRVVNRSEVAEELCQDVFVKAFNALAKFEKGAKFSTWVYRIAVNHAFGYLRKHKLDTLPIEASTHIADKDRVQRLLLKKEQAIAIERGMKVLSESDRMLLSLYYLKELSLDEIAYIMDAPANTIKVKIHRGRARLAKALHQLYGQEVKSLL